MPSAITKEVSTAVNATLRERVMGAIGKGDAHGVEAAVKQAKHLKLGALLEGADAQQGLSQLADKFGQDVATLRTGRAATRAAKAAAKEDAGKLPARLAAQLDRTEMERTVHKDIKVLKALRANGINPDPALASQVSARAEQAATALKSDETLGKHGRKQIAHAWDKFVKLFTK